MDPLCKIILEKSGIFFENENTLHELLIERDILISIEKYEEIQKLLPELKKILSSTVLTSLHKNANDNQRWPLLNLVRQILSIYKYKLIPIRKADGYTPTGIKKYKRFFLIQKRMNKDE